MPLYTLEPKLRCNFRGYDGKRRPCGFRGEFSLVPGIRKATASRIYHWPIGKDDELEAIEP